MIEIETPRLKMTQIRASDWAFFSALQRDPEVLRFVGDPLPETTLRAAFETRLPRWSPGSRHWLCLVLRDKQTQQPLGLSGFVWREPGVSEVGFMLDPAAFGQGYGSESLRAVCRMAFSNPSMRKLTATVTVGNQASRNTLEKCNFQLEGCLRENYMIGGEWKDDWIFSLLRRELG
ncbi:N-acetyltransferase GCN5 [Salmonella enterica subsp. enterica serovar Choleraesuis]|nr:N-acetyltransferase GCN5 [Salmonella enterica subsp. enterica serovar Choleraesuis]